MSIYTTYRFNIIILDKTMNYTYTLSQWWKCTNTYVTSIFFRTNSTSTFALCWPARPAGSTILFTWTSCTLPETSSSAWIHLACRQDHIPPTSTPLTAAVLRRESCLRFLFMWWDLRNLLKDWSLLSPIRFVKFSLTNQNLKEFVKLTIK